MPDSQGLQIAALSSVALLTVELWPNTFAFASDLTKLIGITIAECCAVAAFDVVYLWRLWHEDVPDAYQLLPSVLHGGDAGTRWAGQLGLVSCCLSCGSMARCVPGVQQVQHGVTAHPGLCSQHGWKVPMPRAGNAVHSTEILSATCPPSTHVMRPFKGSRTARAGPAAWWSSSAR